MRWKRTRATTVLEYLAVFFLAALLHAWMSPQGAFVDPDSFYHAKFVALMSERGVIREFPWLPFTTLADAFADHHFLYHVLAVPFVRTFGTLDGMRTLAILLAAGAVTALHATLRAYGVRWAPALTAIAATSAGFAMRMNVPKASALAVILLMFGLIALRRGKPIALFVLAWLYVWTHGGWPLLGVVAGAFLVGRFVGELAWNDGSRSAIRATLRSVEARCFAAVAIGSVFGLVLNPYFPQNLAFYREQIVQIAIVGHPAEVGVGAEWYPYSPLQYLSEAGGAFLLMGLCLLLLSVAALFEGVARTEAARPDAREVARTLGPILLALAFAILAGRSKRHVEYFVPFGVLAAGVVLTAILSRVDAGAVRRRVEHALGAPKWFLPVLGAYLVATFVMLGGRSVHAVRVTLAHHQVEWFAYYGVGAWLRDQARPGEIVVHSDWDDFPVLFLRDDRLRYIAGLDAMFLYRKDPERYAAWVAITTGKDPAIGRAALERFGAAYVVVEKDHEDMLENAERDPLLEKAYEDAEAVAYRVRKG